jgi:hypothetical protein
MIFGKIQAGDLTPLEASNFFLGQAASMPEIHMQMIMTSQARGLMYEIIGRQSMMQAFVDIFRLLAGISLAIVPMMFLMKKIRPTKGAGVAAH